MSNTAEDSDDEVDLYKYIRNDPSAIKEWEEFMKQGNELYQCMVETFDDAFDESGKIVDFRIYHMYHSTYLEAEHLALDGWKAEIHERLLPWLHEEHRSGRLFQQKDWKPFRDPDDMLYMFYGYRKLFVYDRNLHEYDKYYLQLVLDDWGIRQEDGSMKDTVNFHLRLYGWKEKGDDEPYISHHRRVPINEDTMRMSACDWNIKE